MEEIATRSTNIFNDEISFTDSSITAIKVLQFLKIKKKNILREGRGVIGFQTYHNLQFNVPDQIRTFQGFWELENVQLLLALFHIYHKELELDFKE